MISLENVSKNFSNTPILHSICMDVKKGSSYVILGQSGSGKTTLLKIIAGLIEPTEGKVTLSTTNIGMLFQKNALFDSLTAIENLDFTLRERTQLKPHERKKLCLQYLESVELSGKEDLYPSELSGGMQKRLSIARTLILRPEVILYDEPTAGLDPITSRLIANFIFKLKQEMGSTLVVITSDIFRAFQLGNILGIFIKNPQGSILKEIGSPALAQQSTDPYVVQFLQGQTTGPHTKE